MGQQLQSEIATWHKFSQNSDLKQELLGTGGAELAVRKSFWIDFAVPLTIVFESIIQRAISGGLGLTTKGEMSLERCWKESGRAFVNHDVYLNTCLLRMVD